MFKKILIANRGEIALRIQLHPAIHRRARLPGAAPLLVGSPSGVALTFDDGPHPTHTRKVLDTLDEAAYAFIAIILVLPFLQPPFLFNAFGAICLCYFV